MEDGDYHEIAQSSSSFHRHLCDAIVWLKDHIGGKEIGLSIVAGSLSVVAFMHQGIFRTAWVMCTAEMAKLGVYATLPTAAMCIIATLVMFPVDFILFWSGAFFQSSQGLLNGTLLGAAACCTGVYLGCIAAFLLGRSLLRPRVEKYVAQSTMLQAISAIIEADGWRFAFIMGLSPLIPNGPLGYACAMTPMTLKQVALSTLGCWPKTAYEVWLAAQAAESFSTHTDHTGATIVLVVLNIVILSLMVSLCVMGKRQYDHYVTSTSAIPPEVGLLMRKRSTLQGFDAEMRRQAKGMGLFSSDRRVVVKPGALLDCSRGRATSY